MKNFSINKFNTKSYANNVESIKSLKYDTNVIELNSESKSLPVIIENEVFGLESSSERNLLEYNFDEISKLDKCTKCLLPETFPFINSNDNGVCNYCINHKPMSTSKFRKVFRIGVTLLFNGNPDVIVPFSGGRDSFALHLTLSDLKLNPIAFTYDWGMVTDLARRNISRLCSSLEIENVIIAANIRQKETTLKIFWLG